MLDASDATTRCDRHAVETDLREDWTAALLDRGFVATEPTTWLIEGLLVYLTVEDAEKLLARVAELSASGSQLALENGSVITDEALEKARRLPGMERYLALWRDGLGDPSTWLRKNGWDVRQRTLNELALAFNRTVPAIMEGTLIVASR